MANIDTFRSNLVGGGARASQFRVYLTFPDWVLQSGAAAGAAVSGVFLIKAASLPASLITPIDVPFRGRIAKIAGERQFGNWVVTVLNDNDFTIRKALESWSRGILDHSSTTGRINPVSYTSDLIVQQLDRNENILKEYKFHNCFPQAIAEIQLDFANVQQIEEYQVEFSIDYWETTGLTG